MMNTDDIYAHIEVMRKHIEKVNKVAQEQANYHRTFADKHFGLGNNERAERHLDRVAAWLSIINNDLAK